MADFPPGSLVSKEDSSQRTDTVADPAMRQEMDGGYVITRPRFTRRPRRSFQTGFTDITDAEKVLLEDFWDAHKGGSNSFTWTDPVSNVTRTVRFKSGAAYQYAGHGPTRRWNATGVVLEEV